MDRGIRWLVAIVLAGLAAPASALAANLCVPNINIPACGGQGAGEPTIGDAVTHASNSGDTIFIDAGNYPETVNDAGKHLTFVGAGPGQTVIQALGSPGMSVSAGSSVSNLTVDLFGGTGNAGLSLAGSADRVAITATNPANTTNNIGVVLNASGTFTHGTVTLPLTGGDSAGYGGVVGAGTVSDSTIQAAVGATSDPSGNMPALRRDRIVANEGVLAGPLAPTLDDLLIRTVPGTLPEVGLGMSSNDISASITARHDTIVGSGSAASAGLRAFATAPIAPESTTVTLANSIIRGYVHSIVATAVPGGFPPDNATTTVNLDHSFYDPTTVQTSAPIPGPPAASATITPDSHSGNFDPLFINTSAGDFHLQAGSPAIDAGDPAPLSAGESTTDLDSAARLVAGHAGDAAISDVGAFEFVPHGPMVAAVVGPSTVAGGRAARFTATGSDPSPGDAVSFRWAFDDGATTAGASVTHAFIRAGRHRATVTATDLDGFTATASAFVTVTGPALSRLSVKRFTVGRTTTISYRDSQAAKTTFAVLKAGRSGKVVGTFTHNDRAGRNSFRWNGRLGRKKLPAGHYRLRATPRNRAGTGSAVTVGFVIRPAPRHRHGHR
ncbi:MAG: PKD domain-containing protein [Solirubrobacteraceae bacterium]